MAWCVAMRIQGFFRSILLLLYLFIRRSNKITGGSHHVKLRMMMKRQQWRDIGNIYCGNILLWKDWQRFCFAQKTTGQDLNSVSWNSSFVLDLPSRCTDSNNGRTIHSYDLDSLVAGSVSRVRRAFSIFYLYFLLAITRSASLDESVVWQSIYLSQ